MVRGIAIWVNGTHYASVNKEEDAMSLLRSIIHDYRNDVLTIHVSSGAAREASGTTTRARR